MSNWYPQAEIAIGLCKKWVKGLGPAFKQCRFFLFGSAIYEFGEQFDSLRSDLDIVCVMPPDLKAWERVSLLVQLKKKKTQLEQQMIPALRRVTCDEPGVSVVAITPFELKANIHKSAARTFFDKNLFLDLRTGKTEIGFEDAGAFDLPYYRRQALEFTQKIRNEFLAVSANEMGGLKPYAGIDPIPKALLRSTAQIVPDAKDGAWYDTRYGLDHLFAILGKRQFEDNTLTALYKKISIRRGAKGPQQTLESVDQLLLAEILFDEACKGNTEEMVSWRMMVMGAQWPEDANQLIASVVRISPLVNVVGEEAGSVILTLRSTLDTFELFDQLHHHNVLSKLVGFTVRSVSLADSSLNVVEISDESRTSALMQLLQHWTVSRESDWEQSEGKFLEYLREGCRDSSILGGARFDPNIRIPVPGFHPIEFDFLLSWASNFNRTHEQIAIEVKRIRSVEEFAQLVFRVMLVRMPLFLVLYGDRDALSKVQEQIPQARKLNSNLHVVTLPFVTPPKKGGRVQRLK